MPSNVLRPWMGNRRQENETGKRAWIFKRVGQGNGSGPGVCNNDGVVDADPLQLLMQELRLPGGRGIDRSARAFAPTVSRPINKDDAMVHGEALAKRELHVAKIDHGTMKQH